MQSEQKVKVGLIKSAIKLSRAIKVAACKLSIRNRKMVLGGSSKEMNLSTLFIIV